MVMEELRHKYNLMDIEESNFLISPRKTKFFMEGAEMAVIFFVEKKRMAS